MSFFFLLNSKDANVCVNGSKTNLPKKLGDYLVLN